MISRQEKRKLIASLSKGEKPVFGLIAQGHSAKEIAAQLNISIKTVEFHKTNILDKFNVRSTVRLWAALDEDDAPYKHLLEDMGFTAPRQQELILLLLDGMQIAEISDAMKISRKTAEFYKLEIYRNLGVNDIAGFRKEIRKRVRERLGPFETGSAMALEVV